ncbi:hypothetical protein DAPPUDRAFT_265547 [Daphnia pulex]|uniref:Uncharacterized protein n=1 Tax=Daphnia pulex TaxID=6669 RepID=E9HTL9_DAPPU|nr:hypothetical protein DAPPUDRAFT_265547 [Daphnia pulex]|eukprot:EFX64913.1 hypothetical protein DAPPUDRAFT_265547 [Daphnia pulex]
MPSLLFVPSLSSLASPTSPRMVDDVEDGNMTGGVKGVATPISLSHSSLSQSTANFKDAIDNFKILNLFGPVCH